MTSKENVQRRIHEEGFDKGIQMKVIELKQPGRIEAERRVQKPDIRG